MTINRIDAVATEGLAAKVLPTKMAKTAMTRIKANQTKIKNNIFALLPTFLPTTSPIVLPSCLTEEIRDIKSCTPPIKMLPKTIHKKHGTHPKTEACMGPCLLYTSDAADDLTRVDLG